MYIYENHLGIPSWHWEIVIYFFAAGIAIGSYIFAAFGQLWGNKEDKDYSVSGYFFALPLIILGGLMLILDLSVPDRFIKFINMLWNPREGVLIFKPVTVMSVGAWAITLFGLIAAISFVYAFMKSKKMESKNSLIRFIFQLHEGSLRMIYLPVGILMAAYIGTYTGILLTTTQWPVWSVTSIIPVLFLASGVSTGLAAIVLIKTKKIKEEKSYIHRMEKADTIIMVAELILIALFLINLGSLSQVLLTGSNGLLLLGGVVVGGLIVPLILRYKPSLLGQKQSLILSSLLILFGGLILRYVLVMGVQHL